MGSTGTKVRGGVGFGSVTPTANTEQEQQTPNTVTGNATLDNFTGMSIQDAAKFVDSVRQPTDPKLNQYSGNSTQGLVATLGLNEKPVVLDDATFDASVADNALNGDVIYRGYGHQSDSSTIDNVKFGDKTYIGNGWHGQGLYFTNRRRYAYDYSGGDRSLSTLTGYIDKNKASVISEAELRRMYNSESSAIRRQFEGYARHTRHAEESAISNYAIYRGYNVIYCEGGNNPSSPHNSDCGDFYIPLTREVLVLRDNTLVRNR